MEYNKALEHIWPQIREYLDEVESLKQRVGDLEKEETSLRQYIEELEDDTSNKDTEIDELRDRKREWRTYAQRLHSLVRKAIDYIDYDLEKEEEIKARKQFHEKRKRVSSLYKDCEERIQKARAVRFRKKLKLN